MQVALIRLAGSASSFVLRLPLLLFLLLEAVVVYRINRHFFSGHMALLSAFFLLTCGDLSFYRPANGTEIDVFYSFVVYLQVLSIFWFFTRKKFFARYAASCFFGAIGFLTKDFPSTVFQGLTLIALCVYANSFRPLFRLQHWVGVMAFLITTGIYFVF